jgi:polyisoprenoid-binding protein YceI
MRSIALQVFAKTAVVLLLISASPAMAAPQTYVVDPEHSVVLFEAVHQDTSVVLGWFSHAEAKIVIDRDDPSKSTLEAYVDAKSETSRDAQRDKWVEESVLKAPTAPDITFKSTRVMVTGPLSAEVMGDLTVAGVTLHDFKLSTTLVDKQDVIGISWTGTLSRKAIGSTAYPEIVGDEINLRFEGEARLQP